MRRITDIVLGIMLVYCIGCRFLTPVADLYATRLYPTISRILSWAASLTSASLSEILAIAFLTALILLPFLQSKAGRSWKRILHRELQLAALLYIWFYMGWGNNYFRSDLYSRLSTKPSVYDRGAFLDFLERYASGIRESHTDMDSLDRNLVEATIRKDYGRLISRSGLSTPYPWQHPKQLLLGRICSASGVMGFIGPFFDELHIMDEVLNLEYPFTLAHEYAHVLGVSEESEANFWAFRLCSMSSEAQIRYSGYLGILPYVWSSAQQLLEEEEFEKWKQSVPKDVIKDINQRQDHWKGLRWETLDEIQSGIYDLFLKGNRIQEGTRNYAGVVGMIISNEQVSIFQ